MLGMSVNAFSVGEWRQKTADLMARRHQGISEQFEAELLRKDGGRVCALLETSPILDADGRYTGSIAGVQDISERKEAEERLKRTLAELDRSNKELEQFAYVTSHDLREPLRMMTSFAQSLQKRYGDRLDATADEYIHYIVDGAARMQSLIDDILIYSRVSTRGLPFRRVELEAVFQDVLANLRAAIEETGAAVTHDPLPVLEADPSQLTQVLQNLVGNGLKFHQEGVPPVVHVSAKAEGQEWVVSVEDNGIGIDPLLFGRLFNLFQRLNSQDKYPGTGVGLAVTKKIVERHGGRIWVESQPGKGSTFFFSLPRQRG
jgi:light-regulated signal transduction histidine kinase (bacteriophytochrome)